MANDPSISAGLLLPGTEVGGKYRIINTLGTGGMGRVYLADDPMLRRKVAVKMVRERLLRDDRADELVSRFESESILPAGFQHPNVITVFERGVHKGWEYFVMEYAPGAVTLLEVVKALGDKGEHIEEGYALDMLRQAALALRAAHRVGVWHRDVKPDNLLVFEVGECEHVLKLIDFGVAHDPSEERTEDGQILGTVSYWAPECLTGEGDHRADLYALGLTFYLLLTAKRALPRITSLPSLIKMRTKPAKEWPRIPRPTEVRPDLSPWWDYLLLHLMEPELEARCPSAQELVDNIEGHRDLPAYEGWLDREPEPQKAEAERPPPTATVNMEGVGSEPPSLPASATEIVEGSDSASVRSAAVQVEASGSSALQVPSVPSWAAEVVEGIPASESLPITTAPKPSEASTTPEGIRVPAPRSVTRPDVSPTISPVGSASQVNSTVAGFGRRLQEGGGLGVEETAPEAEAPTEDGEESVEVADLGEAEKRNDARRKMAAIAVIALALVVLVLGLRDWGDGEPEKTGELAEAGEGGFPSIKYRDEAGTVTKDDVAGMLRHEQRARNGRDPWELGAEERQEEMAEGGRESEAGPEDGKPAGKAKKVRKGGRRRRGRAMAAGKSAPMQAGARGGDKDLDDELGRYFAVGGAVEATPKPGKDGGGVGLELDQRIKVKINTGISSSRHGKVLARPTKALVINGQSYSPKKVVFVGRSSSDDERIYIEFKQMVIDKKHYKIGGHAISGDMAGLKAQVVKSSLEDRQKKRAGNGAMRTATGVAADLVGTVSDTAGRAVREIGGGAVDEAVQDNQVDRSTQLVVRAKTVFEILITE